MSAGFAIYVHWPFCAARCPYCDFNAHVRARHDGPAWAEAIVRELEHVAGLQGPSRPEVASVFFGGGTPSLAPGAAIATVLEAVARLWPMAPDCEITLEANPSSADAGRFRDYRAAGVNRLSVGVQALDDGALRFLGRLHDAGEARKAAALALALFPRVSLDLIYARPGQEAGAWRNELREAIAFGSEHLSLYQLTVEPATPFAVLARAGGLDLPADEMAATLFEVTQEECTLAGCPAYEISNHARPGAECRHNLAYWRYQPYAGVGPGAHGRLRLDGKLVATAGERLPERWIARVARDGHAFEVFDEIAPADAARERLLMGLRLAEGIDADGMPLDLSRLERLVADGLVARRERRIWTTPKGRLVLNSLLAELAA